MFMGNFTFEMLHQTHLLLPVKLLPKIQYGTTVHFNDNAFSKVFAWKLGLALGYHSRIVRSLPFTFPLVCSWTILLLKCFTKLT